MALQGLTEAQLDLVYFAINHAVEMAKEDGTDLSFVVADREHGRELTWLEDVEEAPSITLGDPCVVVHHEVMPSTTSDGTPALLLELTQSGVTVVQPYRPGGAHRRFSLLGGPFVLDSVSA